MLLQLPTPLDCISSPARPKLPRAIEAIQTAAKRGESLTRQLLTFARRQHLTPTVVDLNGLHQLHAADDRKLAARQCRL
jgi:hypothetical protein